MAVALCNRGREEPESRRITINYILAKKSHNPSDFILARKVWCSDVKLEKGSLDKPVCNVIFADEDAHISAALFLKRNESFNNDAWNIYQNLKNKSDTIWKIKNFSLNIKSQWGLRGQNMQVMLSERAGDITASSADTFPFLKYLPFQFTPLEDLLSSRVGATIDIIGYVTTKPEARWDGATNEAYHLLELLSSRRENLSQRSKVGLLRNYGNYINKKNCVYAFLNLSVHADENGSRELWTTNTTIIIPIKDKNDNNLQLVPSKYTKEQFFQQLFPKPRKSNANTTLTMLGAPTARVSEPQPGTSRGIGSQELVQSWNSRNFNAGTGRQPRNNMIVKSEEHHYNRVELKEEINAPSIKMTATATYYPTCKRELSFERPQSPKEERVYGQRAASGGNRSRSRQRQGAHGFRGDISGERERRRYSSNGERSRSMHNSQVSRDGVSQRPNYRSDTVYKSGHFRSQDGRRDRSRSPQDLRNYDQSADSASQREEERDTNATRASDKR